MKKVLILEDEVNIRSFVVINLRRAGYDAIEAGTGAQALERIRENPDIGVAILDIMLPDMDGFEVCRSIRANNKQIGIIMLTARTQEMDKVTGLMVGADDYVTKPFGSAEFVARVRSILRFTRHSAVEGKLSGGRFTSGNMTIDYDSRKFFVDTTEIKLTQIEFNIIALLSEHFGKVLTYSFISKEIWGYFDSGSTKKLQVNMANIRKKLSLKPGENKYISNELGVGYRMHQDN